MSKKHITAPLSYDPGKGRPKEYLAYLNWQEMQALQRLNGGNMERGPRGLPSFPPDDAIGSSQNAGTGNWTGSPGGTTTGTSSTGTTSTGSSNYGTDPSSWSGSGTNYSGTSASTSSTATSSAASSAASSSAASANTTDTAAQQAAAVNNAVEAAKNAALNEDARRAGIGSIDIGPQRTPVNIGGGAISAAVQSGIQQAYSSAIPAAGPVPSGFMSPEQQMIDRQNTMYSPKALSDLYKGIGTFGISDPSVRTKIQQSLLGQTIELSKAGKTLGYESAPHVGSTGTLDPTKSGVATHWTGSVNTKIPTLGLGNEGNGYGIVVDENGNVSYTKKFDEKGRYPQTWHTKGYNQNRIGIANIGINPNQAQIQSVGALGREWFNPEATATSHGYVAGDLAEERRARGEEFSGRPSAEGKALASAFSEGLESPSISINSQFAGISPTSVPSSTVSPAAAESEIAAVEDVYRNGIYPSGSIVGPGQFGYPTKPDGTPVTAEDLAAMPEDVQREYMDKVRFSRMTDEKYPLTTDQKIKVAAVTGITAPVTGNIFAKAGTTVIGGISGLLGKLPGQFGDAFSEVQRGMKTIAKPGQAVAAYERLDPLKQQQLATGYGVPSESPSTGYAGLGGIPTQELGGKNYEYETAYYEPYQGYQTQPVERRRRRLSQYERWDRGIGIPSPGDPNYNEYQDYLAEGGSDRYA